jgi:hypothetical protein
MQTKILTRHLAAKRASIKLKKKMEKASGISPAFFYLYFKSLH